jgi:hypothetical protein
MLMSEALASNGDAERKAANSRFLMGCFLFSCAENIQACLKDSI